MEQHRFDDLTRVLAGRTSRRGVLRGLLGAAAAGLGLGAAGRLPRRTVHPAPSSATAHASTS